MLFNRRLDIYPGWAQQRAVSCWIAYRKRLQEENDAERERVRARWREEAIFHRQKKITVLPPRSQGSISWSLTRMDAYSRRYVIFFYPI